jgi:hypothetical protein
MTTFEHGRLTHWLWLSRGWFEQTYSLNDLDVRNRRLLRVMLTELMNGWEINRRIGLSYALI